jgi:hypothetical protein
MRNDLPLEETLMNIPKSKKINEKIEDEECLDCTLTEGVTFKLNYLQKEALVDVASITGLTPSAFCRHHILAKVYEIRAKMGY